jgi:hypothetical protein
VEPAEEFGQLRLGFVDPIQWRYEVIRPLVLFGNRTAMQRAHETQTGCLENFSRRGCGNRFEMYPIAQVLDP